MNIKNFLDYCKVELLSINYYKVELLFITVFVFGLIFIFNIVDNAFDSNIKRIEAEQKKNEQELYQVWLKVHPQTPLTYHEWEILRKNNMLQK